MARRPEARDTALPHASSPRPAPELPRVRLKIRVHGRHPRFFRKQVEKPRQPIAAGSLVFVEDRARQPVGTGFYNSRSTMAVRLVHRGPTAVGPEHVLELVRRAFDYREKALRLRQRSEAYRLVHAEGDGLPGLIVDRLGEHVVAQVACKGIEPFLEDIGQLLVQRFPGARLVLRVDREAAAIEGLETLPSPPQAEATLREEGFIYRFRPGESHKTGFFCDQRENRVRLGQIVPGRRVLDLFCNGGGFALHAARGGARSVLAADLDEAAVALARANARANRVQVAVEHADAFDLLRAAEPGQWDCIVLDPPKWIGSPEELESGTGRYLDLNALALAALEPGGILVTCSCSGSLSEERFLHVLRESAARAGRDARVLALTGAGPDHPIALECPETRYLKVVWLTTR